MAEVRGVRDDDTDRRRLCCDEGAALPISPLAMRDCLAVVLYVEVVPEVMCSKHRDAEVAVRFILVLGVLSLRELQMCGCIALVYCSVFEIALGCPIYK